jgi:hypothetical protein
MNLILFPKNPFFERKKRDAGFALPNSSKPTNVKLWSGLSNKSLCKSVNVVE